MSRGSIQSDTMIKGAVALNGVLPVKRTVNN